MKTKYTKHQIEQLNKMNRGAFINIKFDSEAFEKACLEATESFKNLQAAIDSIPKRKSMLERIYDSFGNFIHGGKSIAPAELKGF